MLPLTGMFFHTRRTLPFFVTRPDITRLMDQNMYFILSYLRNTVFLLFGENQDSLLFLFFCGGNSVSSRIYSDLAAVEEQESALTKDVDLFNKLQQDLKESPAYK